MVAFENVGGSGWWTGFNEGPEVYAPVSAIDKGLYIEGKLTVTGLIDPTGLVLDNQNSAPASDIVGKIQLYSDNSGELIYRDGAGDTNTITQGTLETEQLMCSGTDAAPDEASPTDVKRIGYEATTLGAGGKIPTVVYATQSGELQTFWYAFPVGQLDNLGARSDKPFKVAIQLPGWVSNSSIRAQLFDAAGNFGDIVSTVVISQNMTSYTWSTSELDSLSALSFSEGSYAYAKVTVVSIPISDVIQLGPATLGFMRA
jgi:hypothetical protein